MKISKDEFSEKHENDFLSVSFGNKKSNVFINQHNLQFGHQTHENNLLKVNKHQKASVSQVISSDGQYTNLKDLKLGLYTADCIPCFIVSKNQLFSLHLGWRSIAGGLFEKALEKIGKKEPSNVFIGPHIQQESFEVGLDMIEHFMHLNKFSNNPWCSKKNETKYLVSLSEILKIKAESYNTTFYTSTIDTYTSEDHNSYRGDRQTPRRNISFAFLKN